MHDNQIRILFIEDLPFDAELAELNIRKGGIDFISMRVESKNQFINALKDFGPDIVISDYILPQFNGMEALIITREHDISLPFIILTGNQNEEIAIECIKSGATDYVMKEHLVKLSFSVKDALRHRDVMRKKIRAEASLLESESRYRSMFENNFAVMLIADPRNGVIIDVNPAAEEYYGYNREVFIGMNISEISSADEKNFDLQLIPGLTGNRRHVVSQHVLENGAERDVEIFCSPVNYMGNELVHCIIQDITERNVAVNALQASLDEKKELIREIYHRTKNNMQVIISMLSLQTVFSDDEKLGKVLKDMESRIRAMSLVHDKLYKSKNLSKLELKGYLIELADNIVSGYHRTYEDIEIVNEMVNIEVLIDTAVPCGLVVNELISNAVRYAYPDKKNGKIFLNLSIDKSNVIELVVADNGAGKGMDFNLENFTSMGLQIVKNIVEYQLKGEFTVDNTEGLKWTIRFKDNIYEERI